MIVKIPLNIYNIIMNICGCPLHDYETNKIYLPGTTAENYKISVMHLKLEKKNYIKKEKEK